MDYVRKEVYDMLDNVFIKILTLMDAYEFFHNSFEANHNIYQPRDFVQLSNLLHIIVQYGIQIKSDINCIYEQVLCEFQTECS